MSNKLIQLISEKKFQELETELSVLQKEDIKPLLVNLKNEVHNTLDLALFTLATVYKKHQDTIPNVESIVTKLLDLGANPNSSFDNDYNSFLAFCSVDNPKILDILINNTYKDLNGNICHRADLNHYDRLGRDAQYQAILADAAQNYQYLHENHNTNINHVYLFNEGNTPLHIACINISTDTIISKKGLITNENLDVLKTNVLTYLINKQADSTIANRSDLLPEELVPSHEDYANNSISQTTMEGWDDIYLLLNNHRVHQEKHREEVTPNNTFQYKF